MITLHADRMMSSRLLRANVLRNGYGLYDMAGNVWEWTIGFRCVLR